MVAINTAKIVAYGQRTTIETERQVTKPIINTLAMPLARRYRILNDRHVMPVVSKHTCRLIMPCPPCLPFRVVLVVESIHRYTRVSVHKNNNVIDIKTYQQRSACTASF